MGEQREFESIDHALGELKWWTTDNLAVIRELTKDLAHGRVYTPASGGYVGIVPADGGPIISLHVGYVAGLRDEAGRRYWVALPDNRIRDGGESHRRTAEGDACPECGVLTSLALPCEECYGGVSARPAP